MNRKLPTYTSSDLSALYGTRPATSMAQTAACPDGYTTYTLQSGDTLTAIAAARGTTVDELLFYNAGLNPYGYAAGEVICVPVLPDLNAPASPDEGPLPLPTPALPAEDDVNTPIVPDSGPVPLPTPALPSEDNGTGDNSGGNGGSTVRPNTPSCENGTLYTVRSGDTLRAIARRFGVTLDALMQANPGNTNYRLIVGQRLCIPVQQQTDCAVCCPEGATSIVLTSADFVEVLITYNISYAALAAANPDRDLTKLTAGSTLCIPPIGSRGACAQGVGTVELTRDHTAAQLAQELLTTLPQLMIANPLFRPTDFVAGRLICVPASGEAQ